MVVEGFEDEVKDLFHLKVKGRVEEYKKVLKVNLHYYESEKGRYHAHDKDFELEEEVHELVEHVLGLDTSPCARPYVKVLSKLKDFSVNPAVSVEPLTPIKVAELYNFPTGLDGTGRTVGVIELGGGYTLTDLNAYFKELGITTAPKITAVSVDGGVNNPSDQDASAEVVLDVDIIASVSPGANIRVYFTPNTNQGFYDAIAKAVADKVDVISISWGSAEAYWLSSTLTSFNNLFSKAVTNGVTVCAAAGDSGSSDGVSNGQPHVDFHT